MMADLLISSHKPSPVWVLSLLSLLSENLQQGHRSSSSKSERSGVGRRGGDGALGGIFMFVGGGGSGLASMQAVVQFRADM